MPRRAMRGTRATLPVRYTAAAAAAQALLNVLERHPDHAQRFAGVIAGVWTELDAVSLFADVGFAPRTALWGEFLSRLRRRVLPASADTRQLSELFELLFPDAADEAWLAAMDDELVRRLGLLFAAAPVERWRREIVDGITVLVSQVRAAGFAPAMRLRMDAALQQQRPFQSLVSAWEGVERALRDPGNPRRPLTPALQYLRGLLDRCRSAARSVPGHLEAHGVSVDLIFAVEQMLARIDRIEALLACLLSPDPGPELRRLTLTLVREVHERRSIRTLFAEHYSLLARKLTERSAETGEHYITRTPAEYRDMLRRAAWGGSVIAGTTLGKFALAALGLTAFWGGFWAGMLYALSFVLVHLLHWTVATKQPAMTAPALATRLRDITRSVTRDDGLDGFVDEVGTSSARRWPASSAMWRPWCPWCCWPRAWGTGCGAARPSAPPRRTTCCIRSTCSARPCCLRRSPACCCSCPA